MAWDRCHLEDTRRKYGNWQLNPCAYDFTLVGLRDTESVVVDINREGTCRYIDQLKKTTFLKQKKILENSDISIVLEKYFVVLNIFKCSKMIFKSMLIDSNINLPLNFLCHSLLNIFHRSVILALYGCVELWPLNPLTAGVAYIRVFIFY